MKQDRPALGIGLMILTSIVFATQDGISRHLAATYNVLMIVMIRYWVLAGFTMVYAATSRGGVRAVARTQRPLIQIARGLILALEIVVAVQSFVLLGLVETLAIFGAFPMIVAALSGPMLGERVGWRRWLAIAVGFVGLLIILRPGVRVFSPEALLPVASAVLFAFYQILTRMVADRDRPVTSFFWMGMAGVVAISAIGPSYWQPMAVEDWAWMAGLAVLAIVGHFCLIAALAVSEASTVQPFTYLHIVFASAIGVVIFGDALDGWTIIGGMVVVMAGLFTLFRQARAEQQEPGGD